MSPSINSEKIVPHVHIADRQKRFMPLNGQVEPMRSVKITPCLSADGVGELLALRTLELLGVLLGMNAAPIKVAGLQTAASLRHCRA